MARSHLNNPRHGEPGVSLLRSALALGLIALIGAALLYGVQTLTKSRIEAQERLQLLRQLEQVLPSGRFDNAMHEDYVTVSDEKAFPRGQQVRVFRARKEGRPVAVVMRLRTNDGYNGRIVLLIGIYHDGRISGVRVLDHRETPGLGDAIEIERGDWIRSFEGKSLSDPEPEGWAVKRDGGEFDQFTGATITPRAVVGAVRRALEYFAEHRQRLFEMKSESAIGQSAAGTAP